jgi:signal transduction histidine kinase
MKWTKRSVVELIAALVMTAAVVTLAILQYRSTGEISRVEQSRLSAAVATGVKAFNEEFSYEFQRVCESFELDPEAPESSLDSRLLCQYQNWARNPATTGLIADVYVLKMENSRAPYLEHFDSQNERFHEVSWPAPLESLRQFLNRQAANLSSSVDDRQALYYPWTFYEEAPDRNDPMLVRPTFNVSSSAPGANPSVRLTGFLILDLSREFLQQQFFPELVDRNFGASGIRSFEVAVRTAKAPYQAIYLSDPDFPIATSSADATVNLFDSVGELARRRGDAPLQSANASGQWQLVVQHPAGSVEAAVAGLRRRNLAISFGLLAVLAATVVLIFSAARRAERLANLQMEFVTGVSHELCTPLAVINSAAENLVDGVVDGPQQMRSYGAMIQDQSRRLERLIDQVLLFSAQRAGRAKYELRPVEIAETVEQSLVLSEPMLRDAGFDVEKEIDADLPLVVADPAAVGKCMENLFSNAVKYARTNRWLAVRARVVQADTNAEVQITVEDKGTGISTADLPNIFEPFYRVQSAREGQIRGVGLGLYLVKHMMEEMGGRVSVSSELGRGTFFVLHFPVADAVEHCKEKTPV